MTHGRPLDSVAPQVSTGSRVVAWALIVTGLAILPGCATSQRVLSKMKMLPAEEYDPASDTGDPWIQQVGAETRSELPRDVNPDPLNVRRFFVSERARDIERNLGAYDE